MTEKTIDYGILFSTPRTCKNCGEKLEWYRDKTGDGSTVPAVFTGFRSECKCGLIGKFILKVWRR